MLLNQPRLRDHSVGLKLNGTDFGVSSLYYSYNIIYFV